MTRAIGRALLCASVASMSLFAFGCAQTVEDIDRTQPNKVSKTIFDTQKEWYFRSTIVDTDQQGSFYFEGVQSSLKRVRWVITQSTLYACSTTPTVEGPLIDEELPDNTCYGIVAAFPIVDHFDVQRAYNTATGEQSNVLVENRSDRPWYDREYMRVNWSRNMVDGLGMFGSYFGRFASVSWDIPQDDNYVEADRARISSDYIETTSMNTYSPDIYACFYSFGDIYNCEGGLVRIRNSFAPVPEEKTFEPVLHRDREYITKDNGDLLYTANVFDPSLALQFEAECDAQTQEFLLSQDGDYGVTRCTPRTFDHFGRFGFFRTENGYFNLDRGVAEDNRMYYANHWNIWKTAYDDDGNLLDMSARKPRPIVYHLNPAYPKDMVEPARVVEAEWDAVFKETVRLAKGYDTIEQVGDELEDLYGDRRMYKIVPNGCMPSEVVAWLDSNGDRVADDTADPRAIVSGYASNGEGANLEDQLWDLPIETRKDLCAELEFATENRTKASTRFDWQRPGDVRYSYFYWVEEFNNYWSGYGPSSADPITGEIISGTAHMAGTSLRMTAAYAADLIQYMNGELDPNELRYGGNVLEQTRTARRNTAETMSQGLDAMGKREFTRKATLGLQGINVRDISPTGFTRAPKVSELPEELLQMGVKEAMAESTRISRAAVEAKRQDTRFMDFMKRPEIKSLMMADPQLFAAVDAFAREKTAKVRGELTDEDMELAYLDLQSPYAVGYRNDASDKFFAEQNILTTRSMMTAVESLVTYEGVAEAFKGKTREEIQRYFIEKMFVGTQLHEVGHTVGLRHNFNSSMDAINYHDEWWKIQQAVAEGRLDPEDVTRITDPDLIKEITGLDDVSDIPYLNETEFRLGSVMDYTGDLTGRFAGLGKYDQAAINFVYGGMVQRWTDDVVNTLPNGFSFQLFVRDYRELPLIMSSDTSSDNARRLDGIQNILEGREWISIKEANQLVRLGIESNTQNWHEGPTNPSIEPLSATNPPFQGVVIPYNFCTDDRRDFTLGCSVFDWGSNQREIVNHSFNTYRMFQDFWRWSRGNVNRYGQGINGYYGRLFRTFNMISTPFRFYSIYRIWDLGTFTDDLREAAIDSGNFFSEILATPEPGRYCLSDASASTSRINTNWFYDVRNTYLPATTDFSAGDCSNFIDLQPGSAQYYGYDFTNEYEFRVRYVGTFIDKLIATQSLFNVSSNYLFSAFLTDSRATNVSYWTLFQDEMLGMIRGMLLNDYRTFGGMWDEKTQSYAAPRMIDRNTFTYGTPREDEGMERVFSLLSFNHEFNAMVFAMITAGTWADRHVDFPQYLKIAVDNTEVQEYEGVSVAEFINPTTGQKYVAPQTADGKSISYDMVEWANRLEDAWVDSEERAEQLLRDFDIKRENYDLNYNPLNCEDENLTANDQELAVVCEAQLQYDLARDTAQFRSEQLQDVVAKLDQVRYIWQALGPSALR